MRLQVASVPTNLFRQLARFVLEILRKLGLPTVLELLLSRQFNKDSIEVESKQNYLIF
jgi:hypothetical protein